MLVLTRHPGQSIHIDCPDGSRIVLVMLDHGIHATTRERIDLPAIGITAPQEYRITRAELTERDRLR